ncbi:MAG: hypothetical protein IKO32_07440 [Lachnospiraceae bacterium]|nr:hypothetical protein [Lachnospiraceae bacterium]
MITDYVHIYNEPNDYVTTVAPTEEERRKLILSGFAPYRSRRIDNKDDPDFGKKIVLWVREGREKMTNNCVGCAFQGQWCEKENKCPFFKEFDETDERGKTMIKIEKHTEGDSRVAKEVPTFLDFACANDSHRYDVRQLMYRFADMLRAQGIKHDWTKADEPYRSMFYRDLCATIEGRMNFMDGEWAKIHYYEKERHHLKQHCPDDVNLLDVIEMLCDCVAAGMARNNGEIHDVDIPAEVLTKAVANTVEMLKAEVEVVEQYKDS